MIALLLISANTLGAASNPTEPRAAGGSISSDCLNNCEGRSCDEWGDVDGYTCTQLQSEFGCDCTGCRVCSISPSSPTPSLTCLDECTNSKGLDVTSNGRCQDGGPGAEFNLCDLGKDCSDCGPRPEYMCLDDCTSANGRDITSNRVCQDGGPGAETNTCSLGTDCSDCGPRPVASPSPQPPTGLICLDECTRGRDGRDLTSNRFCNDGGPGSESSACELGTDCADCGPRSPTQVEPPSYSPSPPPPTCPGAQEYTECGTQCPPTCANPNPSFCIASCFVGCQCPHTAPIKLASGECITARQCPAPPPTCPGDQEYTECGTHCPPTCTNPNPSICIESCFVGCQCPLAAPIELPSGECIAQTQCPVTVEVPAPPSPSPPPPTCRGDQEYTECGTNCPPTCANPFGVQMCNRMCFVGCQCPSSAPIEDPDAPGECITVDQCPGPPIAIGRPYYVNGAIQLADVKSNVSSIFGWCGSTPEPIPVDDATLRSKLGEHWAGVAVAEHASIASFSQHVLDLLALGAPAQLILGAITAAGDEIRHAQATFALAAMYFGHERMGPGPLLTAAKDAPIVTAAALASATARDGCVDETLGALEAAVAAAAAAAGGTASVARTLETIAKEESRHAALGWATIEWLALEDASILIGVEEQMALAWNITVARGDATIEQYGQQHGVLSTRTKACLRAQALGEVIEPLLAQVVAHIPVDVEGMIRAAADKTVCLLPPYGPKAIA